MKIVGPLSAEIPSLVHSCGYSAKPRVVVTEKLRSYAPPKRIVTHALLPTTARLRDTINLVIHEYRNHPCEVPNCPCMVHRLGLPQADEMGAMLQAVKDAAAQRR